MTAMETRDERMVLAPPGDFWWVVQPLEEDDHGPSMVRWPMEMIADRFLRETIVPEPRGLYAAAVYDRGEHQIIICLCEVSTIEAKWRAGVAHFGPCAMLGEMASGDSSMHLKLNLLHGMYEPLGKARERSRLARWMWSVAAIMVGCAIISLEMRRHVALALREDADVQRNFAMKLSRTSSIDALAGWQVDWHRAKAIARDCEEGSIDRAVSLTASLAPAGAGLEAGAPGALRSMSLRPGYIALTGASDDAAITRGILERLSALADWRVEQHARQTGESTTDRGVGSMSITLRAIGEGASPELAQGASR